MVKDENGKVYIRHWNSNPSPYTNPAYNVSLGVVDEGALPQILAIRAAICCNKTRLKYSLASELDVRIWKTGSQSPQGE